jgi:hypothetical protein
MKKRILIIVLILIALEYFSQPGNPGGTHCWPPPCIPVDGGISIFTFISILFGYKFLARNK